MSIKDIILRLYEYALVNPPATDKDIDKCNNRLIKINAPQLPDDFVAFLQICNGMQYNGMQIFSTKQNEIIHFTAQNRIYYERFDEINDLIFFGRIDDDLYTYNAQMQKYQARDICSFDIWDEYNSFDEFFSKEIMKWLA
ncbi:MAG: YrhA family protein [Proteiniphilum sp.]|nr:YrhA family protein [Proteiniphilum sp.]MDD3908488.1 YrhA family protein [Proteiniphilum sp.]MDD4415977.1 YrhA family protein [Proteiniphilum sp.]